MSGRTSSLLLAVIIVFAGTLAHAEEKSYSYSITPYIGYHYFDNARDLKDDVEWGIRGEKMLTDAWSVEIGIGDVPAKTRTTGESKDVLTYSLNLNYNILLGTSKFSPYLTAGLGGDHVSSDTLNGVNVGVGARWFITDTIALRPEARYIDQFSGRDEFLISIGLNILFGRKTEAAPEHAAAVATVAAAVTAAVDSDHDGVPDSLDKCPDTPAGVKVDKDGCPLDSDHDGVPDYLDKCPDTPAGVKVDKDGCPLDSDHDGVPDYLDKCPNTPAGAKVDKNGCVEAITLKVNFETGKAVVKKDYLPELEQFSMYLKQYPDEKMEIAGYTDNVGSAKSNMALSKERANAIRNILVEQYGIAPARLSAKGYGQDRPIASNATKEGREQNRRVEAVTIK